jgi:hypothetical protein
MNRLGEMSHMVVGVLTMARFGLASITTSSSSSIAMLNTTVGDAVVCESGDRAYCNYRGRCVEDGSGCECYDVLHYWPSEQCAEWHDGRELMEGLSCYPDTVDSYCSWMGVCNSNGTACECFDDHFWASENCGNWHEGPELEEGQLCAPNTTNSYCNWLGMCNEEGSGCNCYDDHFYASENCAEWHESPPLEEGEVCYPGSVNSYCSWMGICNEEGSGCECFDGHFYSYENCGTYHEGSELEEGQYCAPNTPDAHCSWLGTCNANGTACECYDPSHFWASERCLTWHDKPELEEGQCCSPGRRDPYCSWMGVCNDEGSACVCDDPDHWIPAERCKYYHEDVSDPSLPQLQEGECPPEDIEPSGKESSSSSNDSSKYPYAWPYWTAVIVVAMVVGSAFFIHKVVLPRSREASATEVANTNSNANGNANTNGGEVAMVQSAPESAV